MKLEVKQPFMGQDNKVIINNIKIEDINVREYAILAIDGSTSNSGLAILRESDGALLYFMKATREDNETTVRYKIVLKRAIKDMLMRNRFVHQTYYEEPVVANISAVKALFTLRTFIEEMIIEEEPDFDYLQHYEVNNLRWKHEFLSPDKVPQGTENQKKAVRDKLIQFLPFLKDVTQDEIDAIALGFVATQFLSKNQDGGKELQSKQKARPFKYNIRFVGADDDDSAFVEFYDIYNGPEKILQNGISFTEIKSKTDFDKHIFNTMGANEDKVLIIKFPSKSHGDIILKHKIGQLSASYEYIYAIVWRVTRK